MATSPRLADLVRRCWRREFDVVHVHEPLVSFLGVQFLRFSPAINVGTFHAARESGARLYVYTRRLLKDSFRRLDGKIAVSPAAASLIGPHFPGFYNIIPNGVDVERFSAPSPPLPQLDDGMVNILFVGRWEKRKGLRYLLRAFGRVKETPQDTAGSGRPYDQRRSALTTAGCRRTASGRRLAGYVSLEDLPRYHHSCHIFCAPNTGNESQGIILLEAMAAGRPVVASNIEGFAAVVTHGVEGLLVRPKDDEALASALLQLVDDPQGRATMSEACSKKAQDYSWERVSQRVLSYYERLAYEKRSAGANSQPPSSLVEA